MKLSKIIRGMTYNYSCFGVKIYDFSIIVINGMNRDK